MPITTGFKLVEGDVDIVRFIHELRLATIDHVATLTSRSYKRTADRLAKLGSEGYLKYVAKRPHKLVYAIGRTGAVLLVEQGFAPRDLAERRLRDHELKDLGIKHALLVAEIHARVIMLTRGRPFALTRWTEGSSLWDRVTTANNVDLPVRPDALFSLAWTEGKGRAHFFLEADRGTMAHSRMREKVTAYAAYFQQQRHVKKYEGIKNFRVVTISESRGRAAALADEYRSMMPAAWLAAYPVVAVEDLTLERLMPEIATPLSA